MGQGLYGTSMERNAVSRRSSKRRKPPRHLTGRLPARRGHGEQRPNSLVWLTAGAGAAFILLVNGFPRLAARHSGRDRLRSADDANLARVSRIQEGTVHISTAMSAYAERLAGRANRVIACSDFSARFGAIETCSGEWVRESRPSAMLVMLVLLHRVRKPVWDVVMRCMSRF